MCEGEKATKKFCPTGLKFNPTISYCDVPEDVKFVGNEADSAGKFQSKVVTRWTSLPDSNGLKVFSVGGPEENEKHEDNVALNTKKPHKIFSINIFNNAHSEAKTATDNEGVQQDKEQSNSKNGSATETILPQVNAKELQPSVGKEHFHNRINRTAGENASKGVTAENTDPAISEHPNFSYDQLQSSLYRQSASNAISQAHNGTEILSNSKQLYTPSRLNVSSKLPESSFNSHKNLQNVQEAGKTNSSTDQLGFSPYKVFAINLFGLQSKSPTIDNQMSDTYENTRPSGQQTGTAEHFEDVPNVTHNVSVQPLYDQMNDDEVKNTSGNKSEYEYQQQSQLGDFGSKPVENMLPITNEMTSSPLHFKLKVQMDKTGKHPGINCTLSECSEQQNSLVTGSTVGSNYNHDSQKQKNDNEFRITLNTVGPDALRGTLNLDHNRAASLQRVPPQIQAVKFPYNLQDTSQPVLQLLNQTRGKSTQDINDNTTKGGKTNLEVNDNGGTTINEQIEKHNERGNNTEMIRIQSASTSNKSNPDDGLTVSGLPLGQNHEGYVKNPDVQAAAYNDSKLEAISVKNFTEQTVNNNNLKDKLNTKLQATLHQDTLTSQLPQNDIKSQLHRDAQLDRQSLLRAQSQTLGSQPQLKIILKSPGKLGTFTNPKAQLKKRSDARGRIVQILKSLIDKPLPLGAQSRKVVSDLVKKSIGGKNSQSVTDLESIKDSGSIAQSILEANKEYLDDVAMQGMIFSDGDPETENMTDIADSIKLGNKYLQQTSESPHWEIPNGAEEDELKDPTPDQGAVKQDWQNDENVMNQDQDDGGYSKYTFLVFFPIYSLHCTIIIIRK